MTHRRVLVVASMKGHCAVCKGQPLAVRAVPSGEWVALDRCPHCAYRRGIPYFPLPTREEAS